jgi:hypothetical protein
MQQIYPQFRQMKSGLDDVQALKQFGGRPQTSEFRGVEGRLLMRSLD